MKLKLTLLSLFGLFLLGSSFKSAKSTENVGYYITLDGTYYSSVFNESVHVTGKVRLMPVHSNTLYTRFITNAYTLEGTGESSGRTYRISGAQSSANTYTSGTAVFTHEYKVLPPNPIQPGDPYAPTDPFDVLSVEYGVPQDIIGEGSNITATIDN